MSQVRAYMDGVGLRDTTLFERPSQRAPELERDTAAACARRMRAFSAAPSFRALRSLAEALSRAERWEMAAEAWSHIARTHPLDAGAFAQAGAAFEQLHRYESAALAWQCACRIAPDNAAYARAHAAAVSCSTSAAAQEISAKNRTDL